MAAVKQFEVNIVSNNEVQCIPQWIGFNTLISFVPSNPSSIGYAPFIPAPPTEMLTIYTLLGSVKSMLTHFGQHHPAITLHEKIYTPAKEIQWTNYYDLKDMVIRLGGFHRAKNFMGIIGKRMEESGLEDIWQESNFYGEAVTAKVMEGKHYYRGDRGHRITLKASERLRFCKFLEWLKDKEPDHFNQVIEKMNNIKENISRLFGKHPVVCWQNKKTINDKFSELKEEMQTPAAPFEEFISLGISKSEVFEC